MRLKLCNTTTTILIYLLWENSKSGEESSLWLSTPKYPFKWCDFMKNLKFEEVLFSGILPLKTLNTRHVCLLNGKLQKILKSWKQVAKDISLCLFKCNIHYNLVTILKDTQKNKEKLQWKCKLQANKHMLVYHD